MLRYRDTGVTLLDVLGVQSALTRINEGGIR